jgi:hypothetical protein
MDLADGIDLGVGGQLLQEPASGTTIHSPDPIICRWSDKGWYAVSVPPRVLGANLARQPAMVQIRQIAEDQVPVANGNACKPPQGCFNLEKTDYSRWRLLAESGRQTWHYLTEDAAVRKWPQSIADRYHLGLPTVRAPLRSMTYRY